MLGAKPINLLMNNHKSTLDDQLEAVDAKSYRSLIDKLLYLTSTRPNISFAVGMFN